MIELFFMYYHDTVAMNVMKYISIIDLMNIKNSNKYFNKLIIECIVKLFESDLKPLKIIHAQDALFSEDTFEYFIKSMIIPLMCMNNFINNGSYYVYDTICFNFYFNYTYNCLCTIFSKISSTEVKEIYDSWNKIKERMNNIELLTTELDFQSFDELFDKNVHQWWETDIEILKIYIFCINFIETMKV